jgi:class 3 adenylate cyclase
MTDESNMRMFRAAARGSLENVLLAIQAGADLNARDYNNQTALHIARARKHFHLADELVKLGAQSDSAAISTSDLPANIPMKDRHAIAALTSNFPAAVASKMMRCEQPASTYKDCVSIAFLEIAGYPALRGSENPIILCSLLERLWGVLDALAAHHGVDRIDAFDGCYMAVANYSAPQPADHAVRLARFTAAAVAAADCIAADTQRPVRLAGGMHCGAVCGSVVGAYGGRKHTLHGDAVNVASRMESHGAAGAVQCSAATAALIEAQGSGGLRVSAREGGVEVKSLGRVCTAWVWAEGPWAKAAGDACPGGPVRALAGSPSFVAVL